MLAKKYNVVQMRQFFSSKSCVRLLSLPMRGEWIEIPNLIFDNLSNCCLSPCGESGLKCYYDDTDIMSGSLSPCGESGLKFDS